jgi:hypothetical protein
MTNPATLSGLLHLDSFILKREFSTVYLDYAKTNPTLMQTATNQTARPLGCNYAFRSHLPACPDRFAALTRQLINS